MTVYLILSAIAGAGGMAAAVRWVPMIRGVVVPTKVGGGGGPKEPA